MIDLSQNGITHDQALRALLFDRGQRDVRFELRTLRRGVRHRTLRLLEKALRCQETRAVKYSGTFTVMDDPQVDWRGDMLQLSLLLEVGGKTLCYPFPRLKPTRVRGTGRLTIEASDETVLLQDSSIGERLCIPAGTRYTQFIEGQLKEAGFTNMLVEPSAAVLAADREDWAPETSRLTLCNALLNEIGYRSLEIDSGGILRAGPYRPPGEREHAIHYRAGESSVLLAGCVRDTDYRLKPNRFVGYSSHPDAAALRVEYRNDDPASVHSPGRNGGYAITAVRQFQAADAAALESLVRRWVVESDMQYERVTMQTAVMPHHEIGEIITVDCAGASGVYTETGWVIGEVMTHILRRLDNG